jgi:hypothetical protein
MFCLEVTIPTSLLCKKRKKEKKERKKREKKI